MEVLSYALAAIVAQPVNDAINANLHLAGAAEAGSVFTQLYRLLKPYKAVGLVAPPTVELGVRALQRVLTDGETRPYLEGNLGPAGIRIVSIVLQAAGGPQRERPALIAEPQFGTERVIVQAAPAVYPGGINVQNNFGGAVDLREVGGPGAPHPAPPTPTPAPATPALPPPTAAVAPVIAAVAAIAPTPGWGAPVGSAPAPTPVGPTPPAPLAPPIAHAPPPAPTPVAPAPVAPVPVAPGPVAPGRPMPPAVAPVVAAAMAAAVPRVLPPAPKPEPKTPWGKRGSTLADYTFQVVTALVHLFKYGKLHLGWATPEWSTNAYGLEWGWVRLTTTAEAEAVLFRLPSEEVSDEARAAVSRARSLHRHKELPAIQEALNKLGEFPEIARSLQLEHYTTRVYSPADDVARDLAEVSPIAWLIAANTVRLGGALSIRHAAFPGGASKPTDWTKWLDAQEKLHRSADKSTKVLESLRLLAASNPLLDFATPTEIIDDEGRMHEVTAQAIFSPSGVLDGGKA